MAFMAALDNVFHISCNISQYIMHRYLMVGGGRPETGSFNVKIGMFHTPHSFYSLIVRKKASISIDVYISMSLG